MKIGLIDVDGHNFPNFALMKLSAWHKAHGDEVEWYDPMFTGHCDRVYMSKVFTFTEHYSLSHRRGRNHAWRNRLRHQIEIATGNRRINIDGLFHISAISVFDTILFAWMHS